MAPDNRPRSREKKIAEGSGSVKRRGSGLDSKPIQSTGGGGHQSGRVTRGGGISLGTIILIVVVLVLLVSSFFRRGKKEYK